MTKYCILQEKSLNGATIRKWLFDKKHDGSFTRATHAIGPVSERPDREFQYDDRAIAEADRARFEEADIKYYTLNQRRRGKNKPVLSKFSIVEVATA